ncbi:Transcription initiation factor IIB protein, partial [Marine Group I thaumarchaeote SCGC AAA799-B03]
CRISGTHRTLKDMQKVSGVNRRNLTKYYRLLIKEFNWQIPVVDPTQCVVRIANNAGVSEKTKRTAIDILHKVKQQGFIDGKDPTSVAAAAIYIAGKKTKEVLSFKKIGSAANITELTIRNVRKRLEILVENS